MKFKVGDKVKIREGLEHDPFPFPGVSENMLQYKGKMTTIKEIDGDIGTYKLEVDDSRFSWTDEMMEEVLIVKPIEQVIEELEGERDAIKAKNKKAGQMIARGGLDQEQNYLLAAQKHGYDTVCHILDIRIRSLKKQLPAPEPEPKKYNVKALGLDDIYYWKSVTGNLRFAADIGNDDTNQQFTMAEIEKYGLKDCPRFEVQDD
jgi:hypothetical protein